MTSETTETVEQMEKDRASAKSASIRNNWEARQEFLISLVGLSVGIGNMWRFPFLAYENGGGTFLVPYLTMVVIVGKPMFFIELAIGQFSSKGPIKMWSCVPIAKGIGIMMCINMATYAFYYNIVMSWALYYTAVSFNKELPWTACDNSWATSDCVERRNYVNNRNSTNNTISSRLFLERSVLELSSDIDHINGIKWDLALILLINWIIVVSCLIRRIKTSGKVAYFVASSPYILLLILLCVGITKKGAFQGIYYFLVPDWNNVLSLKVWQTAASQMMISLGVATGCITFYSSRNDFRHPVYYDALTLVVVDTATGILAGLVVFAVLGAIAHEFNCDIRTVAKADPGLAFVVFPEALSLLFWPQMWSVIFFLMCFLMGLDSSIGVHDMIVTCILNEITIFKKYKIPVTIIVTVLCYLLGLPFITRAGLYIMKFVDYFGVCVPVHFIAVAESISIAWVYGYENVVVDVEYMLNKKLGLLWAVTVKYCAPLISTVLFISIIISHKRIKKDGKEYPLWTDIIGWFLVIFTIAQFFIFAAIVVFKQKEGKTFTEKIILASKPDVNWGPKDKTEREAWKVFKESVSKRS